MIDSLQPITSFVEHADAKFRPITTLCLKNGPPRDIPWTAFKMTKPEWVRVKHCAEIIEVPSNILAAAWCLRLIDFFPGHK